jgi:hypothetical protein
LFVPVKGGKGSTYTERNLLKKEVLMEEMEVVEDTFFGGK